jgi:acetyl esterase/lipase
MRDDLARALRELPAELSRATIDATKALYAPLHEARPYRDLTLTRDLNYGLHERHRLDIFNTGGSGAKPVFMLVHGGGFVGGDKSDQSGPYPYYENIGVWAARAGFVGVTITYRRAPEHLYPAGAEDVGNAIRWVRANIAKHGGDPDAIVLMGQSAGATHVASYIGLERFHPVPGGGIAGVIVFSGIYDFVLFGPSDTTLAYLGDRRRSAAAAALPGLAATDVPLLFANSEFDPPEFHLQAKALFDARYEKLERTPDYLYLPGHNHVSQVANLGAAGAEDAVVSERLARFVRQAVDSVTARSSAG